MLWCNLIFCLSLCFLCWILYANRVFSIQYIHWFFAKLLILCMFPFYLRGCHTVAYAKCYYSMGRILYSHVYIVQDFISAHLDIRDHCIIIAKIRYCYLSYIYITVTIDTIRVGKNLALSFKTAPTLSSFKSQFKTFLLKEHCIQF